MGVWMVPVTDKVDVGISFGPTIFLVKQELPDTIQFTEPGPTVTGMTTKDISKTQAGVNFGVDVTYLLTKKIGHRRHSPLHVGFGRSRRRHRFAHGRWISDRSRRALSLLSAHVNYRCDRIHPDYRS